MSRKSKIFKRPKSREDGSDFDNFWTESIVSMQSIFSKFSNKRKIIESIDWIGRSNDRDRSIARSRSIHQLIHRWRRHNFCKKIGHADAIFLVRKSWKSEPSSRFFGRLKIFENFIRSIRYSVSILIDIASEGHGGPPWFSKSNRKRKKNEYRKKNEKKEKKKKRIRYSVRFDRYCARSHGGPLWSALQPDQQRL